MNGIDTFIQSQLAGWETARKNYEALSKVRIKELPLGGIGYKVQFNPARIVSSAAKVDKASLTARKCFLCAENRPSEQTGIAFGDQYTILINPFPIFPRHLTIPVNDHTPQRILPRFGDMLRLAAALPDFTIFYNGPKCGASAPDHAHFQAGNRGFMPLESAWADYRTEVCHVVGATLYHIALAPCPALAIVATEEAAARSIFEAYYHAMKLRPGEEEPMMNILCWKEAEAWTILLFPRKKHRPACYSAEGEANILLSPASVDMGGVFITPLEKDFEKITSSDIEQILNEVCLSVDELLELERQIKTTL